MTRSRDVADTQDNSGGPVVPSTVGKNYLINGGFDIWQRGTSFPSQSVYTADRWYNSGSNAITGSQQSTNPPSGSRYFFRQTATSTSGYYNLDQYIETANAAQLWGKTVTFSVKLRRSSTFDATLFIGIEKTSTVDGGSGATWTSIGTTNITGSTISSGTGVSDWTTYSLTVAIPSDGTANTIRARAAYLSNPASGAYVEFAQFQLEIGSVATAFARSAGTIQGELAACQRYYFRMNANNTYSPFGNGNAGSGTLSYIMINHPVTMRTVTSSVDFSNLAVGRFGSPVFAVTAVALQDKTTNITLISTTNDNSSYAAGSNCSLNANNSTSAFIGLSAEL
jgi:hypothetical protein